MHKIIEFSVRDLFRGRINYMNIFLYNLFTYLTNNSDISLKTKKKIFKKIVKLIKNIHAKDIMHGDLKLENIICKFNRYNELFLIDFGLSKACIKNKNYSTNNFFGTVPYVAPELYFNKYSLKSDIWSLGCLLYIFIFDCLPFTNNKIRYKQVVLDIDNYLLSLKTSRADIDKDLFNLIFGLLEPDPYKRLSIEQVYNHKWLSS